MVNKSALLLALVAAYGACASFATAADAIPIAEVKHDGTVDFEKEILPILRKKCLACHNGTEAESDLVLETPMTILKGGGEGPSVVAGKSAESLLLKVASHALEPIMPPKGNDVGAKAMTSEELGLIKLWIDQGAKGEVLGTSGPIVWQSLPAGVNPVYALAVSQTGEYAAAGRANQVFLYHLPSRRELGRLTDPKLLESGLYKNPGVADLDLIQSMAFSPDGSLLATGGYRTLKLWRRPQNVHLLDLPALAAAGRSSATSADGKWIAIGDEAGAIHLFDTAGKLAKTLAGHTAAVTSLEFTADNTQLYSGSLDKSVRVWTLADGAQAARIDVPNEVAVMRLIDKGAQIAVGGGEDKLVRMFKVPTAAAEPLSKLKVAAAVIAASPDRKYLATANADGKIALVDLSTGAAAAELPGHAGGTTWLQFNAASNRLVSIGADKKVNVWDHAAAKLIGSVTPETGAATVAAINAAGTQLAVGADDGSLRTFKIEGETATVENAKIGDHAKKLTALLYANDGSAFFTASEDGTVRRFANNGTQAFSGNHGALVRSIALSADQQQLASGGDDKQLKIWNAGSGAAGPKPQLMGFTGAPQAIAFTPDNLKVIGSDADANQILVFDLMLGTMEQGYAGLAAPATSLVVLPQGEKQLYVLSATADSKSQLWPLVAGKKLAGHAAAIVGISPAAEGQFASASAEGVVKVWDINGGNAVRDFNHGGPITGLVIRADGKRVITAGANNVSKLFNVETNQAVEMRGDLSAKYNADKSARTLALAKRHVDLAKKDLDEATKRKTAEEENAKKAAETVKTADAEAKAKTEAAKQPIADKEAADKALVDATAAKTAAETAKTKADADQKAATEAFTVATQKRDAANKAATDAQAALTAATQKLAAAKQAAAADATNAGLAEAVKVAEKEVADAEAKNKTATDEKAVMEKAFADSDAAKKAADVAKTAADQTFNTANTTFTQATQKVQQLTAPYQKAVDERNVATRNFEAATRSVERSVVSVKTSTEALPMFDAAVKAAEAKAVASETAAKDAATAATMSEKPYKTIALSPDGKTVAMAGDAMAVYTFDTDTGAAIEAQRGHAAVVTSVAFTADGNLVSTAADKSAIVWATNAEWKLERTIGSPDATSPIADRVTAIDFSPDGALVATGSGEPSRSGELKIWNVADGALKTEIKEPHSDTIYDVAFSPNGQYIATCGADRFMKVFDLTTSKLHRSYEGHTHHVLGVAWRADGRVLASGGADNVIKVWNFLTGDQLRTIQGFGKEVTSVTFAGDGDAIAASSGDKSVRLKNAENGGDMRNFPAAADFVYAVGASGDGKIVVAGGADGVVLVWNDQGQPIATFAPPKPAEKPAEVPTSVQK
jgi:WD40 repeat protein